MPDYIAEIPIGSKWQHRNGNVYEVLSHANYPGDREGYPVTIFYRNIDNGAGYTRRADDWHRSMTKISASVKLMVALFDALSDRDILADSRTLLQAADEIDCDPSSCDHMHYEHDTNFSMCKKAEEGGYCPNDIAETLRKLAKAIDAA